MNQKKLAITISAVIMSTILTGCIGGGSSDKGDQELTDKNIKTLEDGTKYDARAWQFASQYRDGAKPVMPEIDTATYAVVSPTGLEILPADLYEKGRMHLSEEKDRINFFGSCSAALIHGNQSLVYSDTSSVSAEKHALVAALSDQSYANMLQKLNISAATMADLTPVHSSEDLWRLMSMWAGYDMLDGYVDESREPDDQPTAWVSLSVIANHAGFDIGGLQAVFPLTDPNQLDWSVGLKLNSRLNTLYAWYQTLTRAEKKAWAVATQSFLEQEKARLNLEFFNTNSYKYLSIQRADGAFVSDTKMPVCISSKLPVAQVAMATKYGLVVANPTHLPADVLQNAIRRETARYGIRAVAGVSDMQVLEYWLEAGVANLMAGFTLAEQVDAKMDNPLSIVEHQETYTLSDKEDGSNMAVGFAEYQEHLSLAAKQLEHWNAVYAAKGNLSWMFDLLFSMRADEAIWKDPAEPDHFYALGYSYDAMNRAFNENYFTDSHLDSYGYTTLQEIKNNYFNIAL